MKTHKTSRFLAAVSNITIDDQCITLPKNQQPGEQTIESFLHGASRASHVDANEIMPVAAILGTFGEHHLMIALEMFAQQSGIVRQFRTIDPQQVGGMAFNQGDASFRCRGSIVFVDQCCVLRLCCLPSMRAIPQAKARSR